MFNGSIEASGVLDPIVVQGDVLIDGRNRMKACLDLGIEPPVKEYDEEIDVYRYIINKNLRRRDLTPDQRAAIAAKASAWHTAERARLRMIEGAKEGGRGHKKNPEMNSSPGLAEPKTRAKDARSTVGQIAQEAKVSHHKAAQAVALAKGPVSAHLDAVAAGTETLRAAHQKIAAPSSKAGHR